MARRKSTAAELVAVQARVDDARKLQQAAHTLDWGPGGPWRDSMVEIRAYKRALDALWAARVVERRAGIERTPAHGTAVERYACAWRELGKAVTPRVTKLLGIVYTADRAEAATDPDECAVLDADVQ